MESNTDVKRSGIHSLTQAANLTVYFLHTILLFTLSDFKTIVIPKTVFGLVSLLYHNDSLTLLSAISNTPRITLWIWINLLPFCIANQFQTTAIAEDLLNKPWRPLPAQRITQTQAKHLMRVCYIIAFISSVALGSIVPCISLMMLGYWYNFANGAEDSFAVRNFINAAGYLSFALGATEVGLRNSATMCVPLETCTRLGYNWLFVLAGVVFTTVHIQDIPDQKGDGARGRKTLPLVIGDHSARWSVGVMVLGWSFVAARMWTLGNAASFLPIGLGAIVALRLVAWGNNSSDEGIQRDKMTFRIWNIWVISLYFLPLLKPA